MLKKITYISPHKTALTISMVMSLGSLLFVIPMAISFSFMPTMNNNGNPVNNTPFVVIIMCMPIFYFIFGYLFTRFSAWVYNMVAKITGGIQYKTSDQE